MYLFKKVVMFIKFFEVMMWYLFKGWLLEEMFKIFLNYCSFFLKGVIKI